MAEGKQEVVTNLVSRGWSTYTNNKFNVYEAKGTYENLLNASNLTENSAILLTILYRLLPKGFPKRTILNDTEKWYFMNLWIESLVLEQKVKSLYEEVKELEDIL